MLWSYKSQNLLNATARTRSCGAVAPTMGKGDINGDGAVSSADAVMLVRYLVDLTIFSESQIYCADLNGDGVVTSADAVLIAKLLTQ